MWVAAAFVTMLCFGVNNIVFKWGTAKGLSKVHIQFFFYLAALLLTSGYGVITGISHFSVISVVLGAMIGVLNANGNIQMSKAFENGPASLTSPLIGMNTIIPIVSAAIIFHEHITLIQWLGIMLMLGSAVVIQYSPSIETNTHYLPWLTSILFAIFSFGILGILMKTTSYLNIHSLNTLVAMYGGGSVYLAIHSFVRKEKWLGHEVKSGAVVGFISVVGYASYFFAINNGTASIVFPIVSLNCLVVVLGGCWVFKERLKFYQLIGVFSALLGILFTKI